MIGGHGDDDDGDGGDDNDGGGVDVLVKNLALLGAVRIQRSDACLRMGPKTFIRIIFLKQERSRWEMMLAMKLALQWANFLHRSGSRMSG